jgi:hypothetical protein
MHVRFSLKKIPSSNETRTQKHVAAQHNSTPLFCLGERTSEARYSRLMTTSLQNSGKINVDDHFLGKEKCYLGYRYFSFMKKLARGHIFKVVVEGGAYI